jgi:hypothetical protein
MRKLFCSGVKVVLTGWVYFQNRFTYGPQSPLLPALCLILIFDLSFFFLYSAKFPLNAHNLDAHRNPTGAYMLRSLLIVGGGVAGVTAGCYAQMNG